MSITEDIKNAARTATNKVVDTTQELTGITKSPKELANRLVEHTEHREYDKVVELLATEVKKYVSKIDILNNDLVKGLIGKLEKEASDLAENLKSGDHKQVVAALQKVDNTISDDLAHKHKVFKAVKDIIKNITRTVEHHTGQNSTPDFKELAEKITNSFEELVK